MSTENTMHHPPAHSKRKDEFGNNCVCPNILNRPHPEFKSELPLYPKPTHPVVLWVKGREERGTKGGYV